MYLKLLTAYGVYFYYPFLCPVKSNEIYLYFSCLKVSYDNGSYWIYDDEKDGFWVHDVFQTKNNTHHAENPGGDWASSPPEPGVNPEIKTQVLPPTTLGFEYWTPWVVVSVVAAIIYTLYKTGCIQNCCQ